MYDRDNGPLWLMMQTFKRDLDKIGAEYNDKFSTRFTYGDLLTHDCLYFTNEWSAPWCGLFEFKGYAISNRGRDGVTKQDVYRIPEQWDEAIEAVKEFIK